MKPIPLSIVFKLFIALVLLGILLEMIGAAVGDTVGLVILAMGWLSMIGAIVIMALFYRCPHCGGYLGKTWYHDRYCPHCGHYLI